MGLCLRRSLDQGRARSAPRDFVCLSQDETAGVLGPRLFLWPDGS